MSRIQTPNGRLALDLPWFTIFCAARRDFLFMSTQAQAVRASFYGDPAGRWKTPASNENLFLGVAWDSMVFWYAILARGEKRFYSHATEIHLIGCLLDCKG